MRTAQLLNAEGQDAYFDNGLSTIYLDANDFLNLSNDSTSAEIITLFDDVVGGITEFVNQVINEDVNVVLRVPMEGTEISIEYKYEMPNMYGWRRGTKIYDAPSGELIRDYRAALVDGVAGFYETINKNFESSYGWKEFVPGEII